MTLLRDNLNNVLMNYDMNINFKGENILKKLADDERNIKYKISFKNQVVLLLIIMIF